MHMQMLLPQPTYSHFHTLVPCLPFLPSFSYPNKPPHTNNPQTQIPNSELQTRTRNRLPNPPNLRNPTNRRQTPLPRLRRPIPRPAPTPSSDAAATAGEIFVPLPHRLPKHRVGHTIHPGWSTPENPVPLPGTGAALLRQNELAKKNQEKKRAAAERERAPTTVGLGMKQKLKIGKAGITEGIVNGIHERWRRSEVVGVVCEDICKLNMKRTHDLMEHLTGGTLLARDKEFVVLYRGKDFLPPAVSSAIEEWRNIGMYKLKAGNSSSVTVTPDQKHGTVECDSEGSGITFQKGRAIVEQGMLTDAEAAIKRTSIKLSMALERKAKAEKLLAELENAECPQEQEIDKEGITEEERYMLRKIGLKMKPFLLLGRRGVFDGTLENIHLHWKYRELVKIICKQGRLEAVHQIAQTLEAESGGILIAVERVNKGYAIIVYRGKNYSRPASLRTKTLLSKKEAMKRSIEAQRRESLKLQVLKLDKNINELKLQMVKDKEANSKQIAEVMRFDLLNTRTTSSPSQTQTPSTITLLMQFLNSATTIALLKQIQALSLKLLTHQHHHYNHFLGCLLLRVLQFKGERSNLFYAHKLFDTMPSCHNSFLWTSLICAFLSHTHFRHCISTYARMHHNGVLPSGFTFSSVLNACARAPAMFEGKQVHARVVRSGFLENKFVQTALLDMYAKCGRVFDAREVFDGMCERDVVAWTAMICGYAKAGMMVDARWLFDKMGERNSFTWTTMVAGYANNGDMEAAKELYEAMDEDDKSVVTWVAMIAGYGKFGNVSEARRVFDGIPMPRDASACAAMLACYAQNGCAKEAIDMYEEMRQLKIKITEVAMVGAVSTCAQLRDVRMSSALAEHLEEGCCDRTHVVSNALIHMHSKCGNINLAWREFSRMKYRDVCTYSAMIAAFAEHGKSQDAIDLFLKMQEEGLQPNQVTFVGVLNACSSSGLIEEGCRYFQIMTGVFGIQPLPEHYACMVDLLGRAGQLERAYSLIKENETSVDSTTWGSLLAACRVYGNVELGEKAARHLFEIDPEDSGNYVLLANTYASKDKWERAEEVKKLMSEKRMKKPSGYSWI